MYRYTMVINVTENRHKNIRKREDVMLFCNPIYIMSKDLSLSALIRPTFVILTLTLSPGFVLLTNIATPLSLATPTPGLPISSMVTMYSSTLIGVLALILRNN